MVSSQATTVEDYLKQLPPDRQEVMRAMRVFILEHLPAGYVKTISWGLLSYEIPLEVFPKTYNRKPLNYIGLAAQKHFNSLYLMNIHQDSIQLETLLNAYKEMCLKPDMGKSCLHFRKLDDLPLKAIGKIIASTPPELFIAIYQQARQRKYIL